MRPNPRPPRLVTWLLSVALPWQYRDETLGDLAEGFARRSADPAAATDARRWYRLQALRSIPGALRLRVQTRHDHRTDNTMETIRQDIRFAFRSMIKSPGFAVVSTVTLALAIGVNTSIFSIVSAIVFAELPMQETRTVALVRGTNAELGIDQGSVSPADYLDLRERARSYESMAAMTQDTWVLTGQELPMRVRGLQATAGAFETWRLPPTLGREFVAGEDAPGAPRVAMLTYGFWQEQFAGRPDVIGEVLMLDGLDYTIVGVADRELEWGPFGTTQVVRPLVLDRADADRAGRVLFVSGRLAAGVTQEMATEEVRAIGEQLASEYPAENRGWGLWSAPVMESLIDEEGNLVLLLLQLTVGMVILIACANVANMLLARASVRAREIAVRQALGAGRGRVVRQLLTESLIISLVAATIGVGVAIGLNRALIWISAGTEVVFQMAVLDRRVLGFTLAVSLVAPLLFALLPALRASSSSTSSTLRDGRSGDGGRSGKRLRNALVTAQVSLALTLMIVATLLTQTVVNMNTRPLGFDPEGLVAARIAIPEATYDDPDAVRRFFDDVRASLEGVGGFEDPQLVNALPGAEFGALRSLEIEGVDLPEGRAAPSALFNTVSAGYFALVGLDIQSGRSFDPDDTDDSFGVAVVSREVADSFWPDDDPVGRRFRVAGTDAWTQVIGVVSDVRTTNESERSASNIYLVHRQDPLRSMNVIGRANGDVAALTGVLREAVWAVDPALPVDPPRTLERALYEVGASSYALISLFVTFAVFALVMAAVGIYGVMAYSVAQRRNEIGLRMAIGAEVGSIRWMVVRQGATLLGAGLVIGILASLGISRLLESVVFGISSTDPATFVGVPLALVAVALLANLIPAARATRTDPATTLRGE